MPSQKRTDVHSVHQSAPLGDDVEETTDETEEPKPKKAEPDATQRLSDAAVQQFYNLADL